MKKLYNFSKLNHHAYDDIITYLKSEINKNNIIFEKRLDDYLNDEYAEYDAKEERYVCHYKIDMYFLGRLKSNPSCQCIFICSCDVKSYVSKERKKTAYLFDDNIFTYPERSPINVNIKNLIPDNLMECDLPKSICAIRLGRSEIEIVYRPLGCPDTEVQYLSLYYQDDNWKLNNHFNQISNFVEANGTLYISPDIEFPEYLEKSQYITTYFNEKNIKKIRKIIKKLDKGSTIFYGKYKEWYYRGEKYLIYTIGNGYRLILDSKVINGSIEDKLFYKNYYSLNGIEGELDNLYCLNYDDSEYKKLCTYVDDPRPFCEDGFEFKENNISITRYGDEKKYIAYEEDNVRIMQMKDGRIYPLFYEEGNEKSKPKLYVLKYPNNKSS